jgi:hypothetical protein
VEETITWTSDPDFGYEIAESLPGVDDPEILQPRRLLRAAGPDRTSTRRWWHGSSGSAAEYLSSFAGLDEAIVKSIG